MASTVLPNGIIIPEKYSRDWYNDLYHNWQELDNLLGGGTPKDGTLTIQKNGDTVGTFSANQSTNETINITVPDVNDGTLTIQQNGTDVTTFSANSSTNATANITVPTKTSDLTNDSNFVPSTDLATVATSGNYNDLSNKPTIPTVNNATLTIQKNGTNVQTFTANQSTNATANITVPTKTSDLTNDSGFITSDNTKIPLAGSNAISGSLIPSTDNSIDIGSSTNNIKMLYTKGITIDGTQFLPSDYIPRSGGAVLNGTLFTRADTNSNLAIRSGPYYADGASIQLKGKDQADASGGRAYINAHNGTRNTGFVIWPTGEVIFDNALVLKTNADNTCSCGASDRRWTEVYAATGTINTSDARLKNSIKDIDVSLLDAWGNIEPKQYKFNDATEKKGDKARYHMGYLAQDIQAECEKQGVNASEYGLFCYDEWEEQEEVSEEIETEKDGEIIKEKHVIQPRREKGNSYALRYEEALVVECKYLRRCIARLTARIDELEKGNKETEK